MPLPKRASNAEVIEQAKTAMNCTQRELATIIKHSKDQLYRWKTDQVSMPPHVRIQLETLITQSKSGTGVNTLMLSMSREPRTGTDDSPMQAFFNDIAGRFELFSEIMPFGLDVTDLTERLVEFGFQLPSVDVPTDRAQMKQARFIFTGFLHSLELLHQWIEANLVDTSQSAALGREAVIEAKGRVRDGLVASAIAKMDISSVNAGSLNTDIFLEQRKNTLDAWNDDIRAFVTAYLAEGYDLIRNPFRLTEADNDALYFEMETWANTKTTDITAYFTLAERTILREVRAVRKLLKEQSTGQATAA
ncbi:hypothetical protein [Salipiger sp. PrR003]|uniref:hypothetical protein n=1 Tax=Salipiger sp. PrR003 TaxID=2706776 RepID=UPI0013DB6394|nr:hypothetical protein [Salipiger sp. PrR003]NDV52825.1 hypothetical protein [Salipiger sp. PrR003]